VHSGRIVTVILVSIYTRVVILHESVFASAVRRNNASSLMNSLVDTRIEDLLLNLLEIIVHYTDRLAKTLLGKH